MSEEQSNRLFTDFSRNTVDFKCNQYCQVVPVDNKMGLWYQQSDPDEIYERGFRCESRTYKSQIGEMKGKQAEDERDRRSRMLAQQAMTVRTAAIIEKMCDSALYPLGHSADLRFDVQSLGKALNTAAETIRVSTREDVKDLRLVMSPDTALGISGMYTGDGSNWGLHGLPEKIEGMDVIVEEMVRVDNRRSTAAPSFVEAMGSFIVPCGTILVCHRPTCLEGVEGGRSFSTCSIHIVRSQDLIVGMRDDEIAVFDDFQVNMTCPISGFLLENVCFARAENLRHLKGK